jgi:hypothetical protein
MSVVTPPVADIGDGATTGGVIGYLITAIPEPPTPPVPK